jgi:hypothetical protein
VYEELASSGRRVFTGMLQLFRCLEIGVNLVFKFVLYLIFHGRLELRSIDDPIAQWSFWGRLDVVLRWVLRRRRDYRKL